MMWDLLGWVWGWIAYVAVSAFTMYVILGLLYLVSVFSVFLWNAFRGRV